MRVFWDSGGGILLSERRRADASYMGGPGRFREIPAGAGGHGKEPPSAAAGAAGAGAYLPRGGGGPVPGPGTHGVPGRGGAELPEPVVPGAGGNRRPGGVYPGQRGEAADHAAGAAGAGPGAAGIRTAQPAGVVPAAADGPDGGVLRLRDRPPGPVPAGRGPGRGHGRQAAGHRPDIRRLRRPAAQRRFRRPLPAPEAPGASGGKRLSPGLRRVSGRFFILQPPGGEHSGAGAAAGRRRHGDAAGRPEQRPAVPECPAPADAPGAHGPPGGAGDGRAVVRKPGAGPPGTPGSPLFRPGGPLRRGTGGPGAVPGGHGLYRGGMGVPAAAAAGGGGLSLAGHGRVRPEYGGLRPAAGECVPPGRHPGLYQPP